MNKLALVVVVLVVGGVIVWRLRGVPGALSSPESSKRAQYLAAKEAARGKATAARLAAAGKTAGGAS